MLHRFRRAPAGAGERGAAMVELALVLPVCVSLILGMVTGGAAYNKKVALTDSVRGAARFGATLNDSASFATSVRDRLVQVSATELTNSDVCVELVRKGSPDTVVRSWYAGFGTCPASFGSAPTTPTVTSGYCVVKVWGEKDAALQAFFFTSSLTLKAGSVGAYERGTTPGVC
jgi:Flp pilus assembly protein TadG